MDLLNGFSKYNKFFLIGIGGAGMSAIAIVLKGLGYQVCGSDLKDSRYTNLLRSEGIEVYIGHDKDHIKDFDAVVYSTAISQSNEELVCAKNKKIPVFTRGEVLSWILNSKKGIAVTGTHGKTTTTSMISLIFRGIEMDPTIIIGGELNELGSNARYGEGEYVIAEACESDGTFLMYKPYVGVITNVEDDHMDYWKDFGLLKESFKKFIGNIRSDGFAVINGDDIDQEFINYSSAERIVTFGIKSCNIVRAEDVRLSNFSSYFRLIIEDGARQINENYEVRLNVPGMHNIKNSLAAFAVCYGLKIDMKKAINILQFFTGAKRRFEKRGEKRGAIIFDDYAHHPTEVKATIDTAVLEKKRKIIVVFQPHRFTRILNMHSRFSESFNDSDILIITDIFASDEKPIPGVTGKLLVDSLIDNGFKKKIAYIPRLDDVKDYLDRCIREDDIVLIMGAGDVTRVTEDLLKSQVS